MRRGEEEQATDIKSDNPHLAGGEKYEGVKTVAYIFLHVAHAYTPRKGW